MDRRTIVGTLGLGALVLAGCATSAVSVEAPAVPRMVTGDLNAVPEAADGGPYVVLIPTSAETRPVPELTAALQTLADAVARHHGTTARHVAYVADPSSGAFDAAATLRAVDALNQARSFGLTATQGPILVVSGTHPTRGTEQDAAAWVFASSDPTQLAQSISSVVPRSDRHEVAGGVPSHPDPLSGWAWLWDIVFPGAHSKPPASTP